MDLTRLLCTVTEFIFERRGNKVLFEIFESLTHTLTLDSIELKFACSSTTHQLEPLLANQKYRWVHMLVECEPSRVCVLSCSGGGGGGGRGGDRGGGDGGGIGGVGRGVARGASREGVGRGVARGASREGVRVGEGMRVRGGLGVL